MKRKPFNYNIFKIYLPAFTAILILLWLSIPGNTSGADDAWTFARLVRDQTTDALILPRYPLYLPLGKAVYTLLQWAGDQITSHSALVIFSMFSSGVTLVVIYHICRRYLTMHRPAALAACTLLLFSWGYWRYSVEAELYLPSMLFISVFMLFVFRLRQGGTSGADAWLAALAGILAVLLYKPNVIPVVFCLPWLLWQGARPWRRPALLILGLTVGIFAGLWVLSLFSAYHYEEFLLGGTSYTAGGLFASFLVVAANQVSFLWVFSVESFGEWVADIWRNKVLSEEVYLQQAMVVSPWVLVALTMVVLAVVILLIVRNRREIRKSLELLHVRVFLLWVIIYWGMLTVFDPSSQEPWIMIQLPLILLAAQWLFVPDARPRTAWTKPVLVLSVFLINLLGGMLLIASETYDYIHKRSLGLVNQTTDNDIIMTFGPKTMEAYLAYHYKGTVLNLEENLQKALNLLSDTSSEHRILILEDVLDPDPAIRYRMGEESGRPGRMILENYKLDTLYREPHFSTFELTGKER